MNENKLNNCVKKPIRETEINRELQRLNNITDNLESVKDNLYTRLGEVLNGESPKDTDKFAIPANSSKLGEALNMTNTRLNAVAKSLDKLLNRLEL